MKQAKRERAAGAAVGGSSSVAEDMTFLMIWDTVRTAPLLGGSALSVDMKKCPPALLRALDSEM